MNHVLTDASWERKKFSGFDRKELFLIFLIFIFKNYIQIKYFVRW